jgi:hypothetical protein
MASIEICRGVLAALIHTPKIPLAADLTIACRLQQSTLPRTMSRDHGWIGAGDEEERQAFSPP